MLKTENEEWGFYGTAQQQGGETFAKNAWKVAFKHVNSVMGWGEIMTRNFLDSRCGRHYADTMTGGANWQDTLTQYRHLESECRDFFKEANPLGYRVWAEEYGQTITQKTMQQSNISTDDLLAAVRTLTGLDYNRAQIDAAIKAAGPLAQALALILADIPEDIRCMYTGEYW